MTDRRRALMAAKSGKVLFQWLPSDGLSALDLSSGTGMQPVLESDGVVLYGGSGSTVQIRRIMLLQQIIPTGDMTVMVDFSDFTTQTTRYRGLYIRLYFASISADLRFTRGGGSTTNNKIRIRINGNDASTLGFDPALTNARIKEVYHKQTGAVDFYMNDTLLGIFTPEPVVSSERGIVFFEGSGGDNVKINQIMVVEGVA